MSERGRPSTYTPEIGERVCAELAKGRSLRAVCRDEKMPAESTVRSWALDNQGGFFAQYTRARIFQAHAMFDELLEIADDGTNDTYEDVDGNPRTDHDVIARSKLRVDTRKWYLAKSMPKLYGERVALEHSGPNGVPIQVTQTLEDAELLERAVQLRNRLAASMPSANGSNGKR